MEHWELMGETCESQGEANNTLGRKTLSLLPHQLLMEHSRVGSREYLNISVANSGIETHAGNWRMALALGSALESVDNTMDNLAHCYILVIPLHLHWWRS